MPKFKRKARMLKCIICRTEFKDVDGSAGPTCGLPSCIGKAREQGKLFAAPIVTPKPTRGGKRRASRGEKPRVEQPLATS